jgi:hypothetical protein
VNAPRPTPSSQPGVTTRLASLLLQRNRLRSNAVQLERDVALAALPRQFGFTSPEGFLLAFKRATSVPRMNGTQPARRRTFVTPEMLDELVRRDAAGESVAEIARALQLAEQTVRNKRSLLGLRRRKLAGRETR